MGLALIHHQCLLSVNLLLSLQNRNKHWRNATGSHFLEIGVNCFSVEHNEYHSVNITVYRTQSQSSHYRMNEFQMYLARIRQKLEFFCKIIWSLSLRKQLLSFVYVINVALSQNRVDVLIITTINFRIIHAMPVVIQSI